MATIPPNSNNPYASPQTPPISDVVGQDEKTWAMVCHLLALLAYTGVPFANLVGPLVVWLLYKDKMPFVDDQGKEVVNFQISVLIYALICIPLVLVVVGFFLAVILIIFHIVVTIIGAVRASQGVAYRYPLCIRLIR